MNYTPLSINLVSSELPFAHSVGRRFLKDVKYVVVHHDAVLAPDTYDAVSRYKAEAAYHIKKDWGHIGYHFKIARDGKIYQVCPMTEIAYHAGNKPFNDAGVGICLDGDFTKQALPTVQFEALNALCNELALHRPKDMPLLVQKGFYGHKEVRGWGFPGTKFFIPNPTACPGSPDIVKFLQGYRKTNIN